MMKSGTRLQEVETGNENLIEAKVKEAQSHGYSVGIRAMEGYDLEGLEAYPDGISFRSERPIGAGKIIELVLCETILVEAEVVGFAPLPAQVGGYLIRARFRKASPELNALIYEELLRILRKTG